MRLVKPVIYPRCFEDESPVGYLHRLAELNQYGVFDWLIKDAGRNIKLPELFELLCQNEWTGFSVNHPFNEYHGLSYLYSQYSKIYICPLCLIDSGYWSCKAHIIFNPICVKHRCWKIDSCPKCNKNFSWRDGSLNSCSCGEKRFCIPERPSQHVLELAAFLDGNVIEESSKLSSNKFPYKSRCDLFMLFARNLNFRGRIPRINSIAVAKNIWIQVADLLIGDQAHFSQFIKKLYERKPEDFQYFYRKLHAFNHSTLQYLKDTIMAFITRELRMPITKRHRCLFQDKPNSNFWLSLQTVSNQFSIPKSTLRQLIEVGKIKHETRIRKKRSSTVIYIESPQKFQSIVDNYINFQNAAMLLGVTSAQLRIVIENGFLKDLFKPTDDYHEWLISAEEIILFKTKLHVNYRSSSDSKISISDALSFYSKGFDSLLADLLVAILDRQITVIESTKEQYVRDMQLDREEFMDWRKLKLFKPDKVSIVELAKRFEINQEAMYQIVNAGLIKVEDSGKNRLNRYVSEEEISAFKEKYAFLSKMALAMRRSPSRLKAQIKWHGVDPIDETLETDLRQTIYLRSVIQEDCLFLSYLIEQKGDWSISRDQIQKEWLDQIDGL